MHGLAALAPLGWNAARARDLAERAPGEGVVPARVTRVDRGRVSLAGPGGASSAPGHDLAVGDWVAVAADAPRVVARLGRTSAITRAAAGRATAPQVLAANVDLVVVVHACDRPLHPRRVHRALAMAWDSGAEARLVLTKADLAADLPALVDALRAAGPGADVDALAAGDPDALERVRAWAAPDRTLCLIGESGAGKSTLVNALVGGPPLATGAVRAGDARGRHTTTARHLLAVPGGGAIIDTPGIRELGLWGAGEGLGRAFADVAAAAAGCRFADCRHEGEPGCAVRAAVEAGELDPARVDSLARLRREHEALELRRDEHAARRHGRRGARMVRDAVRAKGRRPR